MSDVPSDYWCAVPSLQNLSTDQRRMLAIPVDEVGARNMCLIFKILNNIRPR